MVKCKVCKRKCNGLMGLGVHLVHYHKILIKEYYDKFLRHKNEGYCLNCKKETVLLRLGSGYSKYCSLRCSHESKEMRRKRSKNQKGKKLSKKTRIKIGISNRGKIVSNITRKKISKTLKGHIVRQATKHKISIAQIGTKKPCLNKGKTYEEISGITKANSRKKKISRALKGKKKSLQHNKKVSEALKLLYKNPINHPCWRGGTSKLPYGFDFTKKLKFTIRKRDKFKCQECGRSEKRLGCILSVHHIDYDKKNSKETNLTSLCKSCHTKTNFNRQDWSKYFKEKTDDSDIIRVTGLNPLDLLEEATKLQDEANKYLVVK